MKARPRRAENRAAQELTKSLGELGIDFTFNRIPVIGRSGPDLTFPNPLQLAIDVKSRLEVPKIVFLKHDLYMIGDLIIVCKMTELSKLLQGFHGLWPFLQESSKIVNDYIIHMDKWTWEHGGYPALILHRPRMKFENARFVIRYEDLLDVVDIVKEARSLTASKS